MPYAKIHEWEFVIKFYVSNSLVASDFQYEWENIPVFNGIIKIMLFEYINNKKQLSQIYDLGNNLKRKKCIFVGS